MSNSSNKTVYSFGIKIAIFTVVAGALVYMLRNAKQLDVQYYEAIQASWNVNYWWLLSSVLLVPVNWSLEAYKWQYLIGSIEKISFWKALEGVIAGVALGFVTPHGIGDYFARIARLENGERSKGIGAVFITRISQFYITLYFGTMSLAYFIYFVIQQSTGQFESILWFTLFNNVLFVLLFRYHNKLLSLMEQWPAYKYVAPYLAIIKTYSFSSLNYTLLISLVRYIVFCLQFIFLLKVFSIDLPWYILFIGVSFVFFIKSIVPTIMDLGVRETAAVVFFGVFVTNHDAVLFASFTLWMLNIVLPACIGVFLVFRLKLFPSNNYPKES